MNSNYGKTTNSQRGGGSVPLNNYQFDFGLGSSRSRPLNDQKQQSSHSSSFSAPQSHPWQPNKPSWTHQPAPTQTTRSGPSGIGIVDKNPNLFGDLVGSALGKVNSNVPLKNSTPVSAQSTKSPYSMGNLADSLPKTGNSAKSGGNWGNSENFGGYSSGYNNSSGVGMTSKKDPFGSLVDFGSKPMGSLNSASKGSKVNSRDEAFGDFQNAPKSSASAFPSSSFPTNNSNSMGSSSGFDPKMDSFGIPTQDFGSQNQPPVQTSNVDPLDMLFASSASAGTGPTGSERVGEQQFSEGDDWGLDSDFGGGHDNGGTTTELEGLPPPPAGVTAASAKSKGLDNHKQGQYADAIKWLSWAVVLLEKAGDDAGTMEVLTCRASCYKEVGEYKKAVADCSKVLEHDEKNVSVLVQRALLYESIEKYKLGAEDLRTVLKFDPGNRVARSTIHRLTKMAA
ncbi:unnamed protein product, partial [Vitis vinifera]|uniref:Uncharacterized protein n=1 Tax=Vitis vinifera TaxID=29760 RepID=D7SYA4_VITVI